MQEIQHLEDESVEIQVVERFSQETPVWASESEEHQSQGNKMVVNGVTLAVKKNAFLFPVQVGHAGIEERADRCQFDGSAELRLPQKGY